MKQMCIVSTVLANAAFRAVAGCNRESQGHRSPEDGNKDQLDNSEKVDLAPGKSITPQDQARLRVHRHEGPGSHLSGAARRSSKRTSMRPKRTW